MDWAFLERTFGEAYEDGPGQPPLPMIGPAPTIRAAMTAAMIVLGLVLFVTLVAVAVPAVIDWSVMIRDGRIFDLPRQESRSAEHGFPDPLTIRLGLWIVMFAFVCTIGAILMLTLPSLHLPLPGLRLALLMSFSAGMGGMGGGFGDSVHSAGYSK